MKYFYVCASFRKGKNAFGWVTKEKPFEFDNIQGEVNAKAFHFVDRGTIWFDDWFAVEKKGKGSILSDEDCKIAEDVYRGMCENAGRKYKSLFVEDKK